jgi:hypothetical protein
MAYWGIALAMGSNYNLPPEPEREKAAYEALQKALALAAEAPEQERAYVEALAKRYSGDPHADLKKLSVDYKNAMAELVKRYPDDLDATTLYAESAMNLRPWKLWGLDGTPAEGTDEVVAVLESVLRRDPNHTGANHYYIHAVEASPQPERALPSANRLGALAPAAGHLVHMPAHIYIRTGYYEAAIKTNEQAAAADRAYIRTSGVQGIYPLMYYSHNLHFIAMCSAINGDYAEASKTADLLAAHVAPHVKDMPPLEGFMTIPIAVDVRFHKWDEILKLPQPDADMKITTVFWHFARGMALAAKGKLNDAQAEYQAVSDAEKNTPEDKVFAMPVNNKAKDVLKIARDVLGAKIALKKKDNAGAIALLQSAVATQDTLKYSEPEDWFFPVRESLGAALLMNGDNAGAEKVFRHDLENHPRNPRSLFGLQQALKAEGKEYDAGFVQKQLKTSWKGGSTQLKLDDLV